MFFEFSDSTEMNVTTETQKVKCVYFITQKYSFHHSMVIIHDLYDLISGV